MRHLPFGQQRGELVPQRVDVTRWQRRHKHLVGKNESRQPVIFRVLVPASGQRHAPIRGTSYLWQLRKGLRDNPTKRHVEALSSFFGVPPSYFFDTDTAAQATAECELLAAAMRDPQIRRLVARAVGLSPDTLTTLIGMVERARQLEG